MIQIKNVSFSYAGQEQDKGLKDINLTIPNGQVVLLCGVSGCGKTTLIRLMNGLIPHYYEGKLTGQVLIDEKEIHNLPIYETARYVGSVFQNPRTQFFNVDTTSEMAFGAENRGMPAAEIECRVSDTVAQLKIESLVDRSLFHLSGGEKQKIACASAAVCDPSILVLDEPSSNLDGWATEELRKLIKVWKVQGKTIVICEHRLYYLSEIADRAIYIENGRIASDMTILELAGLPREQLQKLGLRPLDLKGLIKKRQLGSDPINQVELIGFKYSYKKSKLDALNLKDVSFPQQSVVAVIGKNGAGKSTLAHCLCGLVKKCQGRMLAEGQEIPVKRRLGLFYMVMQDVNHQLFTESVLDEVTLSMKVADEKEAKRILESLDLLEVKDNHPMSLSGGQKQRVAIAAAIASGREYILFDEPTSGLDIRHMLEVSEHIHQLHCQGKTILIITHDLELIFECCTHVLHLENGELSESYPLDWQGQEKVRKFFCSAEK